MALSRTSHGPRTSECTVTDPASTTSPVIPEPCRTCVSAGAIQWAVDVDEAIATASSTRVPSSVMAARWVARRSASTSATDCSSGSRHAWPFASGAAAVE